MTYRESKAISDRINRKDWANADLLEKTKDLSLNSLITAYGMLKHAASENMRAAAYYAKVIKRRKLEAKKLTGSGDDRRTRIADGPETSGHVEASTAVDGVRIDGDDGHRRPGDRT